MPSETNAGNGGARAAEQYFSNSAILLSTKCILSTMRSSEPPPLPALCQLLDTVLCRHRTQPCLAYAGGFGAVESSNLSSYNLSSFTQRSCLPSDLCCNVSGSQCTATHLELHHATPIGLPWRMAPMAAGISATNSGDAVARIRRPSLGTRADATMVHRLV